MRRARRHSVGVWGSQPPDSYQLEDSSLLTSGGWHHILDMSLSNALKEQIGYMGRTTLILNDELLLEAMELTGVGTKTEVVKLALKELVRARSREAFRNELGTFDLSLTLEELKKLRNAD